MTLTVMVPPAFLALTTTPSMAPSLAEDTCPASACAWANWGSAKVAAAAAAVMIDQRMRIVASRWGDEIRVLQCTEASPVFPRTPANLHSRAHHVGNGGIGVASDPRR